MADPLADLVARVEALESGVALGQLPMASLQRKLESDWQPDAQTLLAPHSISADMLPPITSDLLPPITTAMIANGAVTPPKLSTVENVGAVTITWPGATSLSNTMVVPHGLGVVPAKYDAIANDASLNAAVLSVDATNLNIRCQDVNGTVHALGNFGSVRWYARS